MAKASEDSTKAYARMDHILSHGVGQHRIGELSSQLTDYILDETLEFPKNLRAYCWHYPYKAQVVAHGLGSIFDFRHPSSAVVFSLIKFYPVGFMCTFGDLPDKERQAATRIDHLTNGSTDAEVSVTLNLSYIPGPRWPEAPGKNGVVFHNSRGTIAKPSRR
jgi:hypothetical protein